LRQAYLLDLWLFLRRIGPNALAIGLALLLCGALLFLAEAWPEASFLDCLVRSVYMMTIEGVDPPRVWYLEILIFVMPMVGLVLAAEGLVGATVLFLNKSRRQGEWNAVIAATYSRHTVVCGLGQLGEAICYGLADAGRKVVGVDINENQPAIVRTRREGIPVIIGDMTQAATLTEAGIEKACCIIFCSRDDLANIEGAIVAKEAVPEATVYARVFKKSLADRINSALRFDVVTFSPFATAATTLVAQIGGPETD